MQRGGIVIFSDHVECLPSRKERKAEKIIGDFERISLVEKVFEDFDSKKFQLLKILSCKLYN